jgi:predicted Zn-dependent protease
VIDPAFIKNYLLIEKTREDEKPLTNSQLTIAFHANNVTETALQEDLVHLKIQTKASALRRSSSPIELLLKKYGVTWKVIDLKLEAGNPPNFLASVLHQAVERGDTSFMLALTDYIRDHYNLQAPRARVADYRLLLGEPCTDPLNQAKALAASALANMGETKTSAIAHRYLVELAEAEPENSIIALLTAQSYANRGQPRQEAAFMARAAQLKPDIEQFAIEKVLAHYHAGQLSEAKAALTELETKFPATRGLKTLKREYAHRSGDLEGAYTLTREINAQREVPMLALNELLLYLEAGHTNEFTTLTEEAEKNKPDPGLHRMLAYAYIGMGNFEEALNQLETTRLLGRVTSDVLMETVRTLSILGKEADAAAILEDYVTATDSESDRVNATSYVLHGMGKLKEATHAYTLGLKHQAPLNQVYVKLLKAVCLLEQGKTKPAQKLMKQVQANKHDSLAGEICANFAAMLLGDKTPEAVKKHIDASPDLLMRGDHQTEFFYYAGMKDLLAKDLTAAQKNFEQCAALKHPMHMEYFLARMLLNGLQDRKL